MRRRAACNGSRGWTLFDGLLLVSLLGVVALVMLPGSKVRSILRAEDAAMDFGRELASRVDAYRAAATRDLDRNGVGETPPIADVILPADAAERSPDGTAYEKDGYWFTVLVPGRDQTLAQPSDDPRVARLSEATYMLLAWPVEPGESGMRAYLRTPQDGLLRHAIDGYPYGGPDRPPIPRVALVETRGGKPTPLRIDSKDWIAPVEAVAGN